MKRLESIRQSAANYVYGAAAIRDLFVSGVVALYDDPVIVNVDLDVYSKNPIKVEEGINDLGDPTVTISNS